MRILFCGDIVGRSGRDVVHQEIPRLREQLHLDCVIVNGENAAHGFGITVSICQSLYSVGVDLITTGNHVWDQKEIVAAMDQDKRLVRPINYPSTTPGRGYTTFTTIKGQTVLVINAMARLFMDPFFDDPFRAVETVLQKFRLGTTVSCIILDFHGEASSEKIAMGYLCDGRVSLVVGTHTHVPTADVRILPQGTGYMTDAGMCGDYESIIGMDKSVPLDRMMGKLTSGRLTPAQGLGTLSGVFIETDDATGLAVRVAPVRIGPGLPHAVPSFP